MRLPLVLLTMLFFAVCAFAQEPELPADPQEDVQDAIEALYASQIEKDVQLTDTQLPRVAPLVKRFIERRIQTPTLRNQAMRAWNQAIQRGAPAEEIRRLKEEYDSTDPARLRQDFLRDVDQVLTPQQQQRLRRALPQADKRIQQMLEQNRQQIQERRKLAEDLRRQRATPQAVRPQARPPARGR